MVDSFFFIVAMLGLIFLLSIVVYKFFVFVFDKRRRKYRQFVLEHSIAIQKLFGVNYKYHFYQGGHLEYTYQYDNLDFYNKISCQDYLIYQLQFIQRDILKRIENIQKNFDMYNKYIEEVNAISLHDFNVSAEGMNFNYLRIIEKKLFDKLTLKPVLIFYIKVKLYRTNIHRIVNYERKCQTFDAEEVLNLIERLNNKDKKFYNDREIWNAICRVERGKVSNKLRFEIYERDGYRCCNCGRREDSVSLEIDHIKPISKGGKSTRDNLQTLCRECNKAKGSKY